MVVIFCKFCFKYIEVSTWTKHLGEKTHKENVPSKIIVEGNFPGNRIDQVHEYFSKFGKILKKHIIPGDNGRVTIEYSFEDAMPYCSIAHKDHNLFGQQLEVSWFKTPREPTASDQILEELMTSIQTGSFTQQVTTLHNKLQVDSTKIRDTIHKDLISVFPEITIHFFGSYVTGAAFPGSNLDIFIGGIKQFGLVQNLILGGNFEDFETSEGGIPIIKCKHVGTGVVCHINTRNMLQVRNSELIRYYFGLDQKILQLMVVIKFWAHKYDLIGAENFSGLSISLLVIFYLQQKPYNLPPVSDLQKNLSDFESGWNCAFAPLPFKSAALQRATILELVQGFFNFYHTFDFFSYVVAPFCGSALEKVRFLPPFDLPECYSQYLTHTESLHLDGMSIQDPFVHSRNIPVSCFCGGKFTSLCRSALRFDFKTNNLLHKLLHIEEIPDFYVDKLQKCTEAKWVSSVKTVVVRILTGIFNSQIFKVSGAGAQISYECIANYDVWRNRAVILKGLLSELPSTTSELEKEIAISKRIVRDYGSHPRISWTFHVDLTFETNPTRVKCVLTGLNENSFLHHFVYVKMKKFLDEMETTMGIETPSGVHSSFTKINTFKALKLSVMNSFRKGMSFPAQIEYLQSKIQNKAKISTLLKMIHDDIIPLLTPRYTNPTVEFFGSYVTDMATKVSDLNINVPHEEVRSLIAKSKKFGGFSFDLYMVCVHRNTGITCRIGTKNKKDVNLSDLIKYYLTLDEKLRPLMITLKFWGACYDTKKCRALRSYPMCLLIIFYLQQEYNLPSVMELQKDTPCDLVDGWNNAFAHVDYTNPKLKDASLLELLTGFFRFYSNFDFFTHVISPYFGSAVPKTKFLQPVDLPEAFHLYSRQKKILKVDIGICIQDPFVHTNNILSDSSEEEIGLFAALCRSAIDKIKFENKNLLLNLLLGCKTSASLTEIEKDETVEEDEWVQSIRSFFRYKLPKLIDCEIVEKRIFTFHQISFVITGNHNIWVDRINVWKNVRSCGNQIDDEIAVTSYITASASKNCGEWKLDVRFKTKPARAYVVLEGEGPMHGIRHFVHTRLIKFLETAPNAEPQENGNKRLTQEDKTHNPLLYFKQLGEIISGVPTFAAQIAVLRKKLEHNEDQIETKRQIIEHDLNSALSPTFQDKIHFFDSSVTTLKFQNDTINVYFDDTSSGLATLETVKKLIVQSGDFESVDLFPDEEILVFTHTETQLRCDLTVKSKKLLRRSSELLTYYSSLDDKLQQLLVIIELWADFHSLKNRGLFSRYALHLMVLFYIQREYKVPTVLDLQKYTPAVLVDGWNCSFVREGCTNLQGVTILNLVDKFFDFFSKFDYVSYVVSPFYSEIEKTCFLKPSDLPECYRDCESDVNVVGFCVQDVFEHSKNVTKCVPLSVSGRFTALCRNALSLIQKGEGEFLPALLRGDPDPSGFLIEKKKEQDANEWKESVKNLTLRILTDILRLQCIQSQANQTEIFDCVGWYNVWNNRISVRKKFSFETNEMDKEVATTSCIVRDFPESGSWNFCVELRFKEDPCRVVGTFKQWQNKKSDFHTEHFFYTRLLKFLAPLEVEASPNEQTAIVTDAEIVGSSSDEFRSRAEDGEISEGEDDVPSDFFDDFANDDFLSGLDIADDVNESQEKGKRQKRDKSVSKERARRRRRSRSKSRSRRLVHSRTYNRRRSRSREAELKKARKRSRTPPSSRTSRKRRYSPSPRREDEAKKKSLLEEIRNKLNEASNPVTPPAPVFYGYNTIPLPVATIPLPVAPVPLPVVPVSPPDPHMAVQPYDYNFFNGANPSVSTSSTQSPDTKVTQSEDLVDKLFAEKKMSLSDYLTITAKRQVKSSNPDHSEKKAKVLSQCQDVIQIMSHLNVGPLKLPSSQPKKHKMHESPLHRLITKFKFTSLLRELDPFSEALHKILQTAGIVDEENDVSKVIDSVSAALSNDAVMDRGMAAQILKISLLGSNPNVAKRDHVEKVEVATQCVEVKETVSVEVQVNCGDFNPEGLLSSDSIKYLTSAYLLGRESKQAQLARDDGFAHPYPGHGHSPF